MPTFTEMIQVDNSMKARRPLIFSHIRPGGGFRLLTGDCRGMSDLLQGCNQTLSFFLVRELAQVDVKCEPWVQVLNVSNAVP